MASKTFAEVYAGGRNVNLELVRMGLAYAYRDYLGGCDVNTYLDAEAQAERYRQGVWRWGNETKRWDFLKQQRSNCCLILGVLEPPVMIRSIGEFSACLAESRATF